MRDLRNHRPGRASPKLTWLCERRLCGGLETEEREGLVGGCAGSTATTTTKRGDGGGWVNV